MCGGPSTNSAPPSIFKVVVFHTFPKLMASFLFFCIINHIETNSSYLSYQALTYAFPQLLNQNSHGSMEWDYWWECPTYFCQTISSFSLVKNIIANDILYVPLKTRCQGYDYTCYLEWGPETHHTCTYFWGTSIVRSNPAWWWFKWILQVFLFVVANIAWDIWCYKVLVTLNRNSHPMETFMHIPSFHDYTGFDSILFSSCSTRLYLDSFNTRSSNNG